MAKISLQYAFKGFFFLSQILTCYSKWFYDLTTSLTLIHVCLADGHIITVQALISKLSFAFTYLYLTLSNNLAIYQLQILLNFMKRKCICYFIEDWWYCETNFTVHLCQKNGIPTINVPVKKSLGKWLLLTRFISDMLFKTSTDIHVC